MPHLNIPDVAGWLGLCFIGYTVCLIGWTVWKRNAPRHAERWMKWLKNIRKPKGMIRWPIPFALAIVAALSFLGFNSPAVYTEKNVAVIEVHHAFRYTFQHVDAGLRLTGKPFTQDICHDYESPEEDFKVGTILTDLIHDEEPGCWSLNPDKRCGFYKLRDANRNPIYLKELASNGY